MPTKCSVFLMCLLLEVSCHPKIIPNQKTSSGGFSVTVTAKNLSENFTNNDEIYVVGYAQTDSVILGEPLFWQKLHFTSMDVSRQFHFQLISKLDKPVLVFLIEQDTEVDFDKIDFALRHHYQSIIKESNVRNYSGVEAYLGDDDFLGYKSVPSLDCNNPVTLQISGFYKLDKYWYQIRFECIGG